MESMGRLMRQLVAAPACHRRLFVVVVGGIQASTIMARRRVLIAKARGLGGTPCPPMVL
jgi:hypothetical protein